MNFSQVSFIAYMYIYTGLNNVANGYKNRRYDLPLDENRVQTKMTAFFFMSVS